MNESAFKDISDMVWDGEVRFVDIKKWEVKVPYEVVCG